MHREGTRLEVGAGVGLFWEFTTLRAHDGSHKELTQGFGSVQLPQAAPQNLLSPPTLWLP